MVYKFYILKTAIINTIHNTKQKGGEIPVEDLCASFRKAVVETLVSKFMLAVEKNSADKVVLAGGVSANRLLRSSMNEEAEKRGFRLYYPPLNLCGDNAAMIGSQAYYEFLAGNTAKMDLNACATMNICDRF